MPPLKGKSECQRRMARKVLMRTQRNSSKKEVDLDPSKLLKCANERHKQYLSKKENIIKCRERMREYWRKSEVKKKHAAKEKYRLQNPSEKQKQRQREIEAQRKRFQDPQKKKDHQLRDRETHQRRLQNPENRVIQRQREKEAQRKRLQNLYKKKQHQLRDRETHKRRLQNTENRVIQRQREKEAQRKRLQNPYKKKQHQLRDRETHRRRLQNPENRIIQRQREKEAQMKRLQNPYKKKQHQLRDRETHKRRLQNHENRIIQRQREREAQKKRLQNPENRIIQRQREKEAQRKRLQNLECRIIQQQKERVAQRKRLQDPQLRQIQRDRERRAQKRRLQDPVLREQHVSRVIKAKRTRVEQDETRRRKSLFQKYSQLKKEGPTYECVSCCRLWFRPSVRFFRTEDLPCTAAFLTKTCKMVNDTTVGYICNSCHKSIKKNEIPTLSMTKEGLRFPVVHDSLQKLTDLEERFLAPRIPFMVLRAAVGDYQFVVKGRAINVPIDVESSVTILPRVSSETFVVPICFKRKKAFSSKIMFENVRPKVVEQAAKHLENSPIYHHCGIQVDLTRLRTIQSQMLGPEESEDDSYNSCTSEHDEEDEEEEEPNIADERTLLINEARVFAPGEGKKPLSLFEKYVEALSFIKIYGGQLIEKPEGITYQNWLKSELMRSDRRCAHVTKLFFSALKLRTSKITSSIKFCLRRTKSKAQNLTAKNMLDEEFLRQIELQDSGYKFFAADRGSPGFWEGRKKEVFAAIRQLGAPTIFLTMSPAETHWAELIVILKKVVDGETLTEEQATSMDYKEKARLIRSDPVTLARYFDFRMRHFFSLLKHKDGIFREHYVVDYYIRTEFQQRGSPHCHCLLWLQNSPKYSDENIDNSAVVAFIDRFITCSNDIPKDLLQFQTHRHTFTCKKGSKNTNCRFDIPFFPLHETVILLPLKDVDKHEIALLRQKRKQVQELLADACKKRSNVTIDGILETFQLSYREYITVIRSGLRRATVMLRRRPEECMINQYNPEILKLHQANMDIQFITDMYSCATYVLNYLNKSNRGLSKLLQDAVEEVKRGNYTIREQFRMLGNQFLNASEFSAQEAVYYILALPLSKSSRQCTFINTNPPDKRVAVLKSKNALQALLPDSSDIYVKSIIDHYSNRPDQLENTCLSEFVAWYTFSAKNERQRKNPTAISDDEASDNEDDVLEGCQLVMKDGSGYLYRRTRPKIIRYVNFNGETNYNDYLRESVMLYVPWRDEITMINSSESIFIANQDLIREKREQFVHNENLETFLLEAVVEREENYIDNELHTPENLGVFDAFSQEGDIAIDLSNVDQGIRDEGNQDIFYQVPRMISHEDYCNTICTLNEKQRAFALHVLHSFKTGQLPLYDCVLGGAGVGKSKLIEAIHQTLVRFLNLGATNLDSLKVLLCAPTGKAAFGIKGTTLHAAFVLPLNQCSSDLVPLSNSTRNSIFNKLKDVQLLIIDEISMVGSRMIQQVDCRLKEVFRSPKVFAGISVIVFGDFNQLPPVGDRYIFQPHPNDSYGELVQNPLWQTFNIFMLTEIMRQRDDVPFAEALNNLASGKMTSEQVRLLQSREVSERENIPPETVHLFRTNAEVDEFNKNVIECDASRRIVDAYDQVSGKVTDKTRQHLLESVKSSATKDTQGLPSSIALSVGIRYMLTINIDVEDGLVNGAVGTLQDYDLNGQDQVIRLWLLFSDKEIGQKRRREVNKHGINFWTAIDKTKKHIRQKRGLVSVVRQQFPLIPAEAITIYKSQGSTYDKVAVHLSRKVRRKDLYVALSRCTKLSGLYLIGKFSPSAPPNPFDKVQLEINRLLTKPRASMYFSPKDFPGKETIVYHNVQSLMDSFHWRDLNNYVKINQPSLFVVGETWTKLEDDTEIPGYNLQHRVDVGQKRKRHAYGLSVYARNDTSFRLIYTYSEERMGHACCLVAGILEDFAVCTGYKPPSTPYNAVKHHVVTMVDRAFQEKNKVILLGDFNINIANQKTHSFFCMLKSKGLESRLQYNTATTNDNTAIDVIFSNFEMFCGVTETFFSHHKQLLCVPAAQPYKAKTAIESNTTSVWSGTDFPLNLTEAIQEGKWLLKRLQRTGHLKNGDINICKKLSTFVSQVVYKTRGIRLNQGVEIPSNLQNSFNALKTTGDGNCFYYALSLLLCGKESLMPCLRAIEASHIMVNEEFIENLSLNLGGTIYWKNVLREGTYAEVGDVLLMSLILRKPINIYTDADVSSMRFAPFPCDDELHLYLDMGIQHYTAIVPKDDAVPLPSLVNLPTLDSFISLQEERSHEDSVNI